MPQLLLLLVMVKMMMRMLMMVLLLQRNSMNFSGAVFAGGGRMSAVMVRFGHFDFHLAVLVGAHVGRVGGGGGVVVVALGR